MTDAQATEALYSAFDDPAILRRQLKLNRNGVGPGHFGWLNTADGCDNATCMAKNVAGASGACYSDAGVSLAIGNKNAVEPYFDTRFDIYNQDPPLASPSADPPAINVRKGYLPGHKSNAVDWCSATPAAGSNVYYTYPSNRTVGAATQNSPTLTDVANTTGITAGEPVIDSGGVFASSADNPVTVSTSGGSTVTVSAPAAAAQSSDGLTIEWTTSGLPEDVAFPALSGAEGNGQWDCADYWAINHPHGPSAATVGAALGGVCGTPAKTTRQPLPGLSVRDQPRIGGRGRQRLVGKKWLGEQRPTRSARLEKPAGPLPDRERRAVLRERRGGSSGVDTTTGGVDRRNLVVPIINCLAQTALGNITGAGPSSKTPVAAFGKFFMTQPYTALKDGNLYGEITGAWVGLTTSRFSTSSSCTVRW